MDIITLVKFYIIWIMCDVIELAKSVPLKVSTNDHNIDSRVKRSPNTFSLFGFGVPFSAPSLIANAKDILTTIDDVIFTPPAPVSVYKNTEKHSEPTPPQGLINTNKSTTNNDDIYLSNNITKEIIVNIKQEINLTPENKTEDSAYKIDKQLIDDIFKNINNDNISKSDTTEENLHDNIPDYIIEKRVKKLLEELDSTENDIEDVTPTIDTTVEYTETDEYEPTTTDDFLRIPAPVVASLLG